MGRTIFVGNLNILMKDDELKNAFVKFGLILGSHIVPGKGFGFVTFSDNTAALAALSAMQNEELLHQRIYCFWARNDQQLHEEQRLGLKANASAGQIETSDHLVATEIEAPATQEIYPVDKIKCLQEALVSLPDTRVDKNEEPPLPTLQARNDAFAESKVKELFSESWCT
jgi:RNA recognition motif-containing protein